MKISIILAKDNVLGIGKDNTLPWRLSDDLKNFKKITLNNAIVMGRKTFESIGRPLPNRTNIVLTSNKNYKADGVIICNDKDMLYKYCDDNNIDHIFICGGKTLYELFYNEATDFHITDVDTVACCDVVLSDIFKNIQGTIINMFSQTKNEKNEHNFTYYHIAI